MARQQEQDHRDPIAAAIEHVLEVERDAAAELQHSRELAQQRLAQAREQAAAIGKRADARISALHSAYLRKVQREIERMAQSDLSSGERVDERYDRAMVAAAARRVAARLSGGT